MNKFIVFLFLLAGFQSHAITPKLELIATYWIDSVSTNNDIPQGTSKVVVRVRNRNFSAGDELLFGYGTESLQVNLNDENSFEFTLKTGRYAFQFYPTSIGGYEEITTRNIQVHSQRTLYISLNFSYAMEMPVEVKKPVIYLYPSEETEVSVTVKPAGEMSFTYPEYKDNWECTATPSGEIFIGDNSYNYLFWESTQVVDQEKLRETKSVTVLKEDLVSFLEKSLDQFGFTSEEKMDFITFWGPQMIQYEATEIRFVLNEECNQFAELDITPKPTNLLRFYIVWNKSNTSDAPSTSNFNTIKPSRDGFTVLEWGGLEISPSSNLSLVKTME